MQRKGDHADVNSVDGEEMHRAAAEEGLRLAGAEVVLSAEHHGAVDGGQSGVPLEAPAEELIHALGELRAKPPIRRGGAHRTDQMGERQAEVEAHLVQALVQAAGRSVTGQGREQADGRDGFRSFGGDQAGGPFAIGQERKINLLALERAQVEFGRGDGG